MEVTFGANLRERGGVEQREKQPDGNGRSCISKGTKESM